MHHRLRDYSLQAWAAVRKGDANPLIGLISDDPIFHNFLSSEELIKSMKGSGYLGDAAERANVMAEQIKGQLETLIK